MMAGVEEILQQWLEKFIENNEGALGFAMKSNNSLNKSLNQLQSTKRLDLLEKRQTIGMYLKIQKLS